MTPITASSHLPPAGEPRFGVTPLSPRRLQLHALYRRSGQNRPVDRRRAKLATTIVDPPPITLASASTTQAAAPSNPHKRQTARAAPVGSFLGVFGGRPSIRLDRSRWARIREPSPKPTFPIRSSNTLFR
jgi:hypothetical protein